MPQKGKTLKYLILFVFRKWRIVFLSGILISAISAFYAFSVAKKEYRSQLVFLPPSDNADLPSSMLGISLGSVFGNETVTEQISTIFNSSAQKRRIIERFDLYETYELEGKPNQFERTKKRLQDALMLETLEKSGIGIAKTLGFQITAYHYSPDTAKLMVDFAFELLDSAVRQVSISRAARSRTFVETQMRIAESRLDSLQQAFQSFQAAERAFDIPEQARLTLQAYGNLKARAMVDELALSVLQREYSSATPKMAELRSRLRAYEAKLEELESDSSSGVLQSLSRNTELLPNFTNMMRELEVQNQIIVLLKRELEQARLQEAKNVSSLVVVDPSYEATYKARPKRLTLMVMITFPFMFLLLLFLLALDQYKTRWKNSEFLTELKLAITGRK